jgi:hypothetical protein
MNPQRSPFIYRYLWPTLNSCEKDRVNQLALTEMEQLLINERSSALGLIIIAKSQKK